MTKIRIAEAIGAMILAVLTLGGAATADEQTVPDRQIVVVVNYDQQKAVPKYAVGTKELAAENLVEGLQAALQGHGQTSLVFVLVDSRASLDAMDLAGAAAENVGVFGVRYFSFSHMQRRLVEISKRPTFAEFTTDPEELKRRLGSR